MKVDAPSASVASSSGTGNVSAMSPPTFPPNNLKPPLNLNKPPTVTALVKWHAFAQCRKDSKRATQLIGTVKRFAELCRQTVPEAAAAGAISIRSGLESL